MDSGCGYFAGSGLPDLVCVGTTRFPFFGLGSEVCGRDLFAFSLYVPVLHVPMLHAPFVCMFLLFLHFIASFEEVTREFAMV